MTAACPHCGRPVELVAGDVAPAPRPPLRFEAGAGGLPIGRPRPVYRGEGADRMKAWGAVVDTPGARLQIVAKSGKTWTATVTESLGAASSGGHLVALVGSEWQPDPDAVNDRPPNDPDWYHDTDDAPEAAPRC